ncbi:MAG: hypothetical protein ABI564_10290 [Ideonella sp.]
MIKHTLIGGLLVAAVVVAGCDRRPSNPDLPKTETTTAVPAPPVADKSLPSATAALNSPDGKTQAPPTATMDNSPMSKATESAAMPVGGQANDHSAPKTSDQAASAASR